MNKNGKHVFAKSSISIQNHVRDIQLISRGAPLTICKQYTPTEFVLQLVRDYRNYENSFRNIEHIDSECRGRCVKIATSLFLFFGAMLGNFTSLHRGNKLERLWPACNQQTRNEKKKIIRKEDKEKGKSRRGGRHSKMIKNRRVGKKCHANNMNNNG